MSHAGTSSDLTPREVTQVDDGLWLELMSRRWEWWARRARDEGLTEPRRAYAARRARALGRPYSERLRGCARAGVTVRCECPGKRDVRWYTCRQHLVCKLCRKQRSRKYRAKIYAALEARLDEANNPVTLRRMYSRPNNQLVMLTLGVRPSGDLTVDRERLMSGWRTFYKANNRRWGRFAYVGVVELYPTTGGVHLHVVCVWPVGAPGDRTQGDWSLQRKLWVEANTRDGVSYSERVRFSASRNAGKAARYVSKYVAKGLQTDEHTPELRARVLAATYNTRWVFASRGAWVPFEPCCTSCGARIVRARFHFPDAPSYTVADRLRLAGWTVRDGPADGTAGGSRQTEIAFPAPDERGSSRGS